jgi:hypothetical protein
MPKRRVPILVRVGSALAAALTLACCTPGGQFDPTEVVNGDVFSTKKKLVGDREPLFPNGVPGAETGVPPDLVKGYQPPPEQPAAAAPDAAAPAKRTATAAATPEATPATPKPKLKPKAKPKPKVARAPAPQANDPAWNQKSQPPAATNWPAPPQTGGTQSTQSNWPAPPSTAPAQQSGQAGQGQSIWPNPPAPGTYSH